MIGSVWQWLTDGENWSGDSGIGQQILAHLQYSTVALVLAALIAVPLGMYVGHTGRGRVVAVNLVGAFRAIPTLGVLFIAVLLLLPRLSGDLAFVWPSLIVLVLLAIPPVLSGVYAGIQQVDADARDAARGMGMVGWQVLLKVELPCALPLIFSGLRSAMLQIIATATIAAVVSLEGLGRFLIDGLAFREYEQMAGGAVLVALLALTVDLLLAGIQKLAVSPGLSGASSRAVRGGARDVDTGTAEDDQGRAPATTATTRGSR